MAWPSVLSAATMPATWVPCPDDVSLSLYGPSSTATTRGSLPSGTTASLSTILMLWVTRFARSGWVASMPLSTMATATPWPLTPPA